MNRGARHLKIYGEQHTGLHLQYSGGTPHLGARATVPLSELDLSGCLLVRVLDLHP